MLGWDDLTRWWFASASTGGNVSDGVQQPMMLDQVTHSSIASSTAIRGLPGCSEKDHSAL